MWKQEARQLAAVREFAEVCEHDVHFANPFTIASLSILYGMSSTECCAVVYQTTLCFHACLYAS